MKYNIIKSSNGQLVDTVDVPASKYAETLALDKYKGCFGRKVKDMPTAEVVEARPEFDKFTYCCDAWTSGNPGMGGFQSKRYNVNTSTWIESVPVMNSKEVHTNNYFEIYGILVTCQQAIKDRNQYAKGELADITIYTDSKTALSWITKQPKTANEKDYIVKISNIINEYLKAGGLKIQKWDTQEWGEIPADFGRKA